MGEILEIVTHSNLCKDMQHARLWNVATSNVPQNEGKHFSSFHTSNILIRVYKLLIL